MYCKEGLGFCSVNKNTASHQPRQSLTAARQSLTVVQDVQDSSGGSGVSSKISVLQTVLWTKITVSHKPRQSLTTAIQDSSRGGFGGVLLVVGLSSIILVFCKQKLLFLISRDKV